MIKIMLKSTYENMLENIESLEKQHLLNTLLLINKDFAIDKIISKTENKMEISNDINDVLNGKQIKYFIGNLDLWSLKTAKDLVLPEVINGYLNLKNLTNAEDLILPKTINGYLHLKNLTTAKGLKLPKKIDGFLDLNNLTNAEGLVLPKIINSYLYLNKLETLKGVILPDYCRRIYYKGGYYSLEEIKELQKKEEKND